MDAVLEKALDFSNYRQTLAIQRKALKEKMLSRLTYAQSGGVFTVNQGLIVFVQMLLDQGRSSGVVILDSNENPIVIDNLEKFRDEIFDRYFSATLEYQQAYQKLKSSRTVEKLVDL
jgi:hypothetical protein